MRLSILVGTLGAALALASCGGDTTPAPDDGTGGSSAGGKGGSGTGGKGSGGSGTGGVSGDGGSGPGTGGTIASNFTAVKPCDTEAAYMTGDTIVFEPAKITYTPKCLKVKVGDTVTFKGAFVGHPLHQSMRGDHPSPIPMVMDTGMDQAIKFDKAGTFAYYCGFHGSTDTGANMAGVVWVTP
jgi:plastocyanin